MDIRTTLIAILGITFMCFISIVIFFRRSNSSRLSKHVIATITKIEVEATSLSNGWIVKAQWLDTQTGQIINFRSHRIQFPPRMPVGGPIAVVVDPRNPAHYHMEI